jgi:hypothetical protein
VAIPDSFSIVEAPDLTQITGAATADGAASGGECTLTDTTSPPFTDVRAGDIIHNTTDGSSGIVRAYTSTSVIITCLFGGTNNDWTSADAYIINPQKRFYLWLDPPPSTASYTVRVWYVQKPTPVYSSYRSYPFPTGFSGALVSYAAWLYKFRDSQPDFADRMFKYWDYEVRNLNRELDHGLKRTGFKVDLFKD